MKIRLFYRVWIIGQEALYLKIYCWLQVSRAFLGAGPHLEVLRWWSESLGSGQTTFLEVEIRDITSTSRQPHVVYVIA